MKNNKFIFVLVIGFLSVFMSCQEDEKLNLQTYPENKPSAFISDSESGSEVVLNVIYNEKGMLELKGDVNRTHLFRFAASLEDIVVSYEILSKNIPTELIEINITKDTIPVGFTDSSVEVTLKSEDFINLIQSNDNEEIYEIGVKAYAKGYKTLEESTESKIIIKKEAYSSVCTIVGEKDSETLLERVYTGGKIGNKEPISYSFKIKLDKPALKDSKINLAVAGLDEKFLNTITTSPNEIIIPKGEIISDVITWTIKDDFLLETEDEETHRLTISLTSDDSFIITGNSNPIKLDVLKVLRNIQLVPAILSDWSLLDTSDWIVDINSPGIGYGKNLIDGKGGAWTPYFVQGDRGFSVIVDMKDQKTINGLGIDYYEYVGNSSKKVEILTSTDKENWTSTGVLDTPRAVKHYFKFIASIDARYVEIRLLEPHQSKISVTEIYIYN